MTTPTLSITNIKKNDRKQPSSYPYNRDYKAWAAYPRIYITAEDYNVIEDLFSGRQRPHAAFKKQCLEGVLKDLNIDATKVKVSWSQKAGCGCGCSPGFILKSEAGYNNIGHFDVWVKYKA